MKKYVSIMLVICLGMFSLAGLSGCDSDSDDSTSPITLYNITGTWIIAAPGLAAVWTITQDASGNLTGTSARTGDTGTLTGTNINNTVTIHVYYASDNASEDFTGTVASNNDMSGTYSDSYGTTGEGWTALRDQ
jgi:hypothetical protein